MARRREAGRSTDYHRRADQTCDNCGDVYERRVGDRSRFCSLGCANESLYGLSRSRELIHVGPVPKPVRPAPVAAPPPRRVIVQGDCAWCGQPFAALTSTGKARTCSVRCAARLKIKGRAHARGKFLVSSRRRRRLHGRDNWTCQICRLPTSQSWSAGDPWSPTLDHIEPQSTALIPDHSDANLRTAHALCNSFRREGILSDQTVALIAERRRAGVPS